MNTSSSENSIKKNMEEDLERRTFRARQHVKKLTNEGKKELIDTIINKHQGEGTSPSEELEYYFGNDISDELTAHNIKMKQSSVKVSPMIPIKYDYGRNPINYGRKNGGKKGKTQRKNKKSKKSKTQRKIKKTKKSKTRKSTRRRR